MFLKSFHTLLVSAIFALSSDAAVLEPRTYLSKCPGGARELWPIGRSIYGVCPGTDYYSPNINTCNNVPNTDACATKCAQTDGCAKASYNSKLLTCYLKGNPSAPVWFETSSLDTIRLLNVDKCPVAERSVTVNGATYSVCPGTDYYSPNINVIPNVGSVDDCVSRCAQTDGCAKASFNLGLRTCYLKGSPSSPIWFATDCLDTIRFVSKAEVGYCPA